MKQELFTPGEWELLMKEETPVYSNTPKRYPDSIRVKEWTNCDQMGDYQGCIIASFLPAHGQRQHAFEESTANACLISQAKNMYFALKECLEDYEASFNATENEEAGRMIDKITEILNQANPHYSTLTH